MSDFSKFVPGRKYRHSSDSCHYVFVGLHSNGNGIFESALPWYGVFMSDYYGNWTEVLEPKTGEFWISVYPSAESSIIHSTREDAYRWANTRRIACIKVTWTEGDGIDGK